MQSVYLDEDTVDVECDVESRGRSGGVETTKRSDPRGGAQVEKGEHYCKEFRYVILGAKDVKKRKRRKRKNERRESEREVKEKKAKKIKKRLVHRHGETSWTPRSENVSNPAMTDPFFSSFLPGRVHRVKFFFFAIAVPQNAKCVQPLRRASGVLFVLLSFFLHLHTLFLSYPLPPPRPLHAPFFPFLPPLSLSFSLSHSPSSPATK